jgi:ComF family protein
MPTVRRCGALWRTLCDGFADLLLPLVCVVCGDLLEAGAREIVCPRCWCAIRPLPHPQCSRCGHPRSALDLAERSSVDAQSQHEDEITCSWCGLLPPYVRAARSVCWATAGTGVDIVYALKYGGWAGVASLAATAMARLPFPDDVGEEAAALVPVPLASARFRERGFNQSELLANAIGARWKLPVWEDVLNRERSTGTQTRLAPNARQANVAGAFALPFDARSKVAGRHLILVDDVITTGATMNACAAALYAAGARLISYLTFGRAATAADLL